jgi:hypothetical protein
MGRVTLWSISKKEGNDDVMINLNYDTMYEQFDYIVEDFGAAGGGPSDQWYDCFCEDAWDTLDHFEEEDWKKLEEELPNKSNAWKKCMVYCFSDNENQHEINILNDLATTEDEDLLLMVVDILRLSFDYNKIPGSFSPLFQITPRNSTNYQNKETENRPLSPPLV